ncbi:hypothetical protein TVAG_336890 [Trichomonas vaginalis G3]|uniref:Surface antigen BspA-like n=1 Tax=Trichomonas vaginalis (strain ATCC PRA-98 / G3) TaxID=412133 RepID=A2EPV9_TRIV3|nr:leucine-rich repeats (6 copies)-containing protein [Trichomonas vaginalis G3]EAY05297.1 hypothetical protein TVAG_336890 [Trichomonas vaginalis G3]KAI5531870.1 leucine-rich repeats (6 copies)-containing protein [Trichomonas vaginalis G3]|eukprot:XP_001317520.1 hypothetical protein [Trichomonas vaginalis G3]
MLRFGVFFALLTKQNYLDSEPIIDGDTITITENPNIKDLATLIYSNQLKTLIIQLKYNDIQVYGTNIIVQGPATAIPDNFMNGNTFIKTVDLSENITRLGSNCFSGSSLESITIRGRIPMLRGDSQFMNCYALKELSIDCGYISENFAANCINLTTVKLLFNTTILIDQNAFSGCYSLSSIDFSNIASIGSKAFYRTNITSLKFQTQGISIDAEAFEYSRVQTIDFGQSIAYLGQKCFLGTPLKSVKLMSVGQIGSYAFSQCTLLESIEVNYTYIPDSFASYCTSLTTVIAKRAKMIGSSAFYNCKSLKLIELSTNTDEFDTITFGSNSFMYCENLEYTFSSPMIYIFGDYAFSYCDKISLGTIITNSSIGAYSFLGCQNIESVTIQCPIGQACFMGCENLESVKYEYTTETSTNEIPDYSFCNCSSLKEFEGNDNITRVGEYAFACTKIKNVVLRRAILDTNAFAESKLETINFNFASSYSFPFFGCSKLEKITISKYTTSSNVFYNLFVYSYEDYSGVSIRKNSKVKNFKLEFEIESGNEYYTIKDDLLLYNSTEIKLVLPDYSESEFQIPSYVTDIHRFAFASNNKIKKLIFNRDLEFVSSHIFSCSDSIKELEISFDGGENHTLMSSFTYFGKLKYITIKTNINKIPSSGFANNPLLKEVILPSSCTEVGYYGFIYCPKLYKINLDKVTKFGEGCFRFTGFESFDFSKFGEEITIPD